MIDAISPTCVVPPWLSPCDPPHILDDGVYLPVLPVPPSPPDWDVVVKHYDAGDPGTDEDPYNEEGDDRGYPW